MSSTDTVTQESPERKGNGMTRVAAVKMLEIRRQLSATWLELHDLVRVAGDKPFRQIGCVLDAIYLAKNLSNNEYERLEQDEGAAERSITAGFVHAYESPAVEMAVKHGWVIASVGGDYVQMDAPNKKGRTIVIDKDDGTVSSLPF